MKVITDLFKKRTDKGNQPFGVEEYFAKFVENHGEKIPTLHPLASPERLRPGGLTRVVCMIQDTKEREFFLSEYELVDLQTKEVKRRCGMYLEEKLSGDQFMIQEPKDVDQRSNLAERVPYYTVAVPNQSSWVPYQTNRGGVRPGWKSPVDTLVRTYFTQGAGKSELKVNQIVEFIGVWAPAQQLPIPKPEKSETSSEPVDKERKWSPHVLHAVHYSVLGMDYPFPCVKSLQEDVEYLQPLAAQIRVEVLAFISEALRGDRILAEYIFHHMMSQVISRKQGLLAGYFALSIQNCPRSKEGDRTSFAFLLYRIYSLLLPLVNIIDMSLKQCNDSRWVPVKNHETGELSRGEFQAPNNTFFIFNETALESGTLKAVGVLNVRAMSDLVGDQKVTYDFEYHGLDMLTNFPCIILTEGNKSIVSADAQVRCNYMRGGGSTLAPTEAKDQHEMDVEALFETMGGTEAEAGEFRDFDVIVKSLSPDKLRLWRKYLLVCRQLSQKLKFNDAATQLAQKDWVAMRQRDNQKVTERTLHYRLNLARARTSSFAETEVSVDRFNEIRDLENARIEGLKNTEGVPQVPAGGARE